MSISDGTSRVVQALCEAGVRAADYYVAVSGEPVDTMPEYFLTCALFNALAPERAITLETPFGQVHKWVSTGVLDPTPLDKASAAWKIDLVIYDGVGKPNDQKVWAFVEVKNGYIDADYLEAVRRTDRSKLERLSGLFPSLKPKLICCGRLNAYLREYHEKKAQEAGDTWFQAGTGDQFFCARLLNGSFERNFTA